MSEQNSRSQYAQYNGAGAENGWDEWNDDPVTSAQIEPVIPVDELLRRLMYEDDLPELRSLYALSDLSREDAQTVEMRWSQIPPTTRLSLVEELVRQAEEDYRLHLGRFLRIALYDSDARIRRLAVEGLWEDEADDLVGAFIHILQRDPSTEVRSAAASALGAFVLAGELEELDAALAMRVEESLLAILRNEAEPMELQCRALESIAYSGEVGVRQLIEDAYYSPYEEMRISALSAMGRSADIRWRGLARAELENPSPAMRVWAAIACGKLEARAAVHEIIELLNDEEQAVRLAAVFALGRLGGKSAREALQAVVESEFEVEVEAAEEALEEMLFYGMPGDIPLLDEFSDVEEEWDIDPWDDWYGRDDLDLGSYG